MDKQGTPAPLTLEQVAEMLEKASQAVRTTPLRHTAERVRTMPELQLRADPVLNEAFRRGWEACTAAINRTLRTPGPPPPKRSRPAPETGPLTSRATGKPATRGIRGSQGRGRINTSTQQSKPVDDEKIPPPPEDWPEVERRRALRFIPGTRYRPINTEADVRPSSSKGPGKRPVPEETATSTKEAKGFSRKQVKNRERFMVMLERRKARKVTGTSQQHRLAKPASSLFTTTHTADHKHPIECEEKMEVDLPPAASGPASVVSLADPTAAAGSSEVVDDFIDLQLDFPLPPFPEILGSDREESPSRRVDTPSPPQQ